MKIHRYAGALVLAGILAAWACSNDDDGGPTSPTPPPAPPVTTTAPPAPTPAPTPPPPDQTEGTPAKARYSARIVSAVGTWGVTIDHLGGWTDERVGVACYENPDRTTGENQAFSDGRTVSINTGGSVTVGAKIPECVPWQCDAFEGEPIRGSGDVFYGRRLILGRSGGPQGNCTPPPTCENPPCNPPVCDVSKLEAEAAGECDQGNFILDVEACTFECKPEVCDPVDLERRAEAACEHGVESLDVEACEWTCKPPPVCENAAELRAKVTADRTRCENAGGEFSFEFFDFPVCEVETDCELPPPCDEHELNAKATAAAQAACEHGVDDIFLDLDECTFDFTCLPPPEVCRDLPDEGVYEIVTGSADRECAQIGLAGVGKDEDGPPWDLFSGDGYLVKCGTTYEFHLTIPDSCSTVKNGISHVTACECPTGPE
jgi:hypothetical protein